MTINEKAAYLKGMLEGMKLDAEKDETKLLRELIDIVNEIALELTDTQDDVETLNDYIEEIDEDLGDVEEYIFGDEYDDFDPDEECCCDCCDEDCCPEEYMPDDEEKPDEE